MSQFDQDCITYTQEGRILQLEYAAKAVETAEYPRAHSGQSLESSARTESSWAQKNKSSPSCSFPKPTPAFTTSTGPSEWWWEGRSPTAATS